MLEFLFYFCSKKTLGYHINLDILFVYTAVFTLGLIDDVNDDKDNKGFLGHFKAFF